jgi:hypothetical protein
MKAFVQWVLARRQWLVVLAMAFSTLLPVLTVALMTLDSIKHGPARSLTVSLVALAGLGALAVVTSSSAPLVLAVGGLSLLSGVVMGGVFRWAGSLNLAFQSVVLGFVAIVLLAVLFGPEMGTLMQPVIDWLVEFARTNGGTEAQLAVIEATDPEFFFGMLLAGFFVHVVGALMLGCWWYSLANPDTNFGIQFRALKLGRVLGISAMVLLTLGMATNFSFIQNLTPLALFAFVFQGLAVMHAWGFAKKWHPTVLALVYLLLVRPLVFIIVASLSMVGLLDNVFSLRSPLRG